MATKYSIAVRREEAVNSIAKSLDSLVSEFSIELPKRESTKNFEIDQVFHLQFLDESLKLIVEEVTARKSAAKRGKPKNDAPADSAKGSSESKAGANGSSEDGTKKEAPAEVNASKVDIK